MPSKMQQDRLGVDMEEGMLEMWEWSVRWTSQIQMKVCIIFRALAEDMVNPIQKHISKRRNQFF